MCFDDPAFITPVSAPEKSGNSLPLSPNSLYENDLFPDYRADVCESWKSDFSECVNPSTLHIKPVTWESLKEIDFPPGEHFDVVEGLLVWVPMAHGTTLHQQILTGFVLLIVQLRYWYATSNVDLEVASLNSSSTKLLKAGDRDVNRRGPDVVVLRDHSPSSESSSESKEAQLKEKCVFRTKEMPPYAVLEVTSESTRTIDLTSKWIQYALTGIKFYYIVDLKYFESSGEACVIVGALEPFDDAVICHHGSPTSPSPSWKPPDSAKARMYYKKVYRGDERVVAGIFKDVQLTSIQSMDPLYLKGLFRSLKHGEDHFHSMSATGKAHSKIMRSDSSTRVHVQEESSSSKSRMKEEKQSESGKKQRSRTTSKLHTVVTTSSSPPRSPEKSVQETSYN